jgi:HemY protein
MLGEANELRKATRIIEAAWVWNPHPDLADAAAHLRPGDSARERLARVEALAAKSQDKAPQAQLEVAVAIARSAIDAQEFSSARDALAAFVAAPTRRVAALMAELEARQGDEGRAREWMARALTARRDPAWTADGFVSDRWLPVSPITGRLDAFEWKDPLAGEPAGALIEASERAVLEAPKARPVQEMEPPRSSDDRGDGGGGGGEPPREPRQPPPKPAPAQLSVPDKSEVVIEPPPTSSSPPPSAQEPHNELPSRRIRSATSPLAPAVIPLLHAPDDPGPEGESEVEPAPESGADQGADSWSKIRQLFRP